MRRGILDPVAKTLCWESEWAGPCEFPRIDPRREGAAAQFAYVAAHSTPQASCLGPQDQLAKVDMLTGEGQRLTIGEGRFVSEPIFVPGPGEAEDGGHVMAMVYDPSRQRAGCVIVDAQRFELESAAWAWFDRVTPPTLHGSWVNAPKA